MAEKKEDKAKKLDINEMLNSTNEDNVANAIKSGNLMEVEVTEEALENISKAQRARKVDEAKSFINELMYGVGKQKITLNKRKATTRIDKKYMTALGEIKDQFLGTVGKDGKKQPGTITAIEAKKKIREAKEEYRKALNDADKYQSELMDELRGQFPHYWCSDWDMVI